MSKCQYVQLPLSVFRQMFPDQAEAFPDFLDRDPRYIVRYDYISGMLEIGYIEDNWLIQ